MTVGPTWSQQAELTGADSALNDQFGGSVSISGNTALVGALDHAVGSNTDEGAVYVFTESGGTWSEQAELTAPDGASDDAFGTSVSISGNTAVVGAPNHTVGSNTDEGAVYVFTESGGTWSEEAELTAPDGTSDDAFGTSVSISGTTALVGAPYHKVGLYSAVGAVYVFSESGGTWSEQAELTPSPGAFEDQFGSSVSLSGATALVGAPVQTVQSQAQGAAYVFTESGTTWSQQAELTASDGLSNDLFGRSVSISGTTALVGADPTVGSNTRQGAAYVFTESGTTWSQQAELTASDGAAFDHFGGSVSLSGTTALIGSVGHTVGSATEAGAAYVFTESGTTWSQQAELTASDGGGGLGDSVSLSGTTTALAGAPFHSGRAGANQGAAYLFSPTAVTVNVSGSQTYGSSTPTFTYVPTGVGLTGRLTCASVSGSIPISPSLEAGSYTIDGPSCTGLTPPTGYALSYVGASNAFVVSPAPTALVVRSVPPGPVRVGWPVAYFVTVSTGRSAPTWRAW